jgi:hypothetical protein
MNKPVLAFGLLGVVPVLALFGCGSGSSTTPSNPQTPVPTTLAPAPTPTPNPFVALCGSPTPPPLMGMKLKVHVDNGDRKQLDSKPIVANVDGYCSKVGTGGPTAPYCETRLEGSTQREACDGLVVGKAKDTGKVGPTWTWNDQPCFAVGTTGGQPGCINLDNQFLIVARDPGNYLACASGEWPVAKAGAGPNTEDGSLCGGWIIP